MWFGETAYFRGAKDDNDTLDFGSRNNDNGALKMLCKAFDPKCEVLFQSRLSLRERAFLHRGKINIETLIISGDSFDPKCEVLFQSRLSLRERASLH
jgi:hypothetical protein